MVAAIMGLPRGSHPFHTHLYNPSALHGTYGVGSMYNSPIGGVHYDCGTVLQPDTGVNERGNREPLADRAVMASLYVPCFGVLALGLKLFPDQHRTCYGPVFSRFYDSAERNYGRPVGNQPKDEVDWLRNFVWTRVYAGWLVLCNL